MPLRRLSGGLVHTPMLEGLPHLITETWRQFFSESTQQSNIAASVARVTKLGETAALTLAAIPITELAAGLYRVSVYTKIMTPASVNSSVQASIVFTDGVDVCTFPGTANTGNTVASVTSDSFLIRITEQSPISYQVTYASNAAGMVYDFELVLEQIG